VTRRAPIAPGWREFALRREGMIHAMDGGLWLHRHTWYGRTEDAIARLECTLDLDPDYWRASSMRALCYAQLGDLRTAAELMAKALAGGPGGTDPTAVRGTASRLSRGPSATFERLLEGARERAAGSAMARVIEIALLMLLDRHDEAIGALQAARHDRSLAFVLLWAPTVDPLAGDPRFRHLFESSGLLLPRWRRG
jgi:tetratricopeptide (TPR) repeat protein